MTQEEDPENIYIHTEEPEPTKSFPKADKRYFALKVFVGISVALAAFGIVSYYFMRWSHLSSGQKPSTSTTSDLPTTNTTNSDNDYVFSVSKFKRFRPYIDKLMIQYIEPTTFCIENLKDDPESIHLAYDVKIFNHKQNLKDETFYYLTQYFCSVLESKSTDLIKRLVEVEATSLGLSVLALAPLPSEYFKDFKALVDSKTIYYDDEPLQYLISLKTGPNPNSNDINDMTEWIKKHVYMNKYFQFNAKGQFGNILNYGQIYSKGDVKSLIFYRLATRAKSFQTGVAELGDGCSKGPDEKLYLNFKISTEPADEIFKRSLVPSKDKLRYTVNSNSNSNNKIAITEPLKIVKSADITKTTKFIMINRTPNNNLAFGQVEKVFKLKNQTFILEAIILNYPKEDDRSVLIYDMDVNVWTLFESDMILSVPTWVAFQLGFNYGSSFIYTKSA